MANSPDDAFDYVILSRTLQATWQPRVVLENLLRIGRRAIVSYPNFRPGISFARLRAYRFIARTSGGGLPQPEIVTLSAIRELE
jgi:hypothetical protein